MTWIPINSTKQFQELSGDGEEIQGLRVFGRGPTNRP